MNCFFMTIEFGDYDGVVNSENENFDKKFFD